VCSSPDQVKSKTIKVVYVVSPLSTQYKEERAKTGWFRIRIMCPSGVTCLSAELFQSVSTKKNPTKHVGLVQS